MSSISLCLLSGAQECSTHHSSCFEVHVRVYRRGRLFIVASYSLVINRRSFIRRHCLFSARSWCMGFIYKVFCYKWSIFYQFYEWCFRRGASLELANTIRRMINLVQDTIPFHSTHFAIVTSKVTWQINECVLNKYCRRFWTRWSLTLLTQPVFYWWPQKVSDPVASLRRRRLQPADHKDVVTLISWSRPWSFGRSVNHADIEGLRQ